MPDWNVDARPPGLRDPSLGRRSARDSRSGDAAGAAPSKPLILAGQRRHPVRAPPPSCARWPSARAFRSSRRCTGIGAFPEDHPLSLGMPGMHGWVHVNRAIQECDVLLNIGGRFDDRVTGKASTFAPNARGDPRRHRSVGDRQERRASPSGSSATPARRCCALLRGDAGARDTAEWLDRAASATLQATHRAAAGVPAPARHRRAHAARRLRRAQRGAARRAAAIASSPTSGSTRCGRRSCIDWQRPRTHITSGGAGTMGFAVPAALGAAIALPGRNDLGRSSATAASR